MTASGAPSSGTRGRTGERGKGGLGVWEGGGGGRGMERERERERESYATWRIIST